MFMKVTDVGFYGCDEKLFPCIRYINFEDILSFYECKGERGKCRIAFYNNDHFHVKETVSEIEILIKKAREETIQEKQDDKYSDNRCLIKEKLGPGIDEGNHGKSTETNAKGCVNHIERAEI